MTDKREKSREEWEQELVDRQQNITPADYANGLHYARIPGLPKIVSLGKFLLGSVLGSIGVRALINLPLMFAPLAVLAVAAGLYLFITSIRWKKSQ